MRLVMKSYSFIRENSTKLLSPWHKDDEDGPSVWYERQMDPSVGSFSKYFYFLFVPTLLYRDHYPRCVMALSVTGCTYSCLNWCTGDNLVNVNSQIKGAHLLEKCSFLFRAGKLLNVCRPPYMCCFVLIQFLAFTYVHFVIYGKWLVPASFK